MKIIDLSHAITPEMPVYPGTEQPLLEAGSTYEKDGFRETKITMYSHVGTHMDAPAHIFAEGRTLDQFPPEQFIGKALAVDCRGIPEGGSITPERILCYGRKAEEADFLLFNRGWDKRWGTPGYFGDYPCLDDGALDLVIRGCYKGIGFDVIGLDPVDDVDLTRHKKLFSARDIINIENLCNLEQCGAELFRFICFPLKFRNADGSPVRAVAFLE